MKILGILCRWLRTGRAFNPDDYTDDEWDTFVFQETARINQRGGTLTAYRVFTPEGKFLGSYSRWSPDDPDDPPPEDIRLAA